MTEREADEALARAEAFGIERQLDNLEKLARALAPFSPRLRDAIPGLPFALDVATLRAGCNFTLTMTAGDLDLFGELPGLGDYTRVMEYAESRKIAGFVCRVLSLEGLILAKKAAGRPKDQAQVHGTGSPAGPQEKAATGRTMKHHDTKTPRDSTEPPAPQNPSEYCPVCSTRLIERSCKLVCPACGFYMSCSDFQ